MPDEKKSTTTEVVQDSLKDYLKVKIGLLLVLLEGLIIGVFKDQWNTANRWLLVAGVLGAIALALLVYLIMDNRKRKKASAQAEANKPNPLIEIHKDNLLAAIDPNRPLSIYVDGGIGNGWVIQFSSQEIRGGAANVDEGMYYRYAAQELEKTGHLRWIEGKPQLSDKYELTAKGLDAKNRLLKGNSSPKTELPFPVDEEEEQVEEGVSWLSPRMQKLQDKRNRHKKP